jgi:hypothetical protein
VVTEALAIDLNAELKLHSQGAMLCACDCSLPVCSRHHRMLSDATYNGGLILSTRFVLPAPFCRRGKKSTE